MYIAGGEIIHAHSRDVDGIEVIYRMIRTGGEGSFEVIPGETAMDRTIQSPWQNILMEGMRLLDEEGPWISAGRGDQDRLADRLEAVFDQSEFEGLVLVNHKGQVVASHLPPGQDAKRLGAVVSGLMNLSTRSLMQLDEGDHMQTVIGGMNGQVIITRFAEEYTLVSLISAEDNLGMAFWEIKRGIDMLQQTLAVEAEG